MTVGSRTVQAESGEALIVYSYQAGLLNWTNTNLGGEALLTTGSLRFVVGEGAFAGGYDANGNLIYRLTDGSAQILTYRCKGLSRESLPESS